MPDEAAQPAEIGGELTGDRSSAQAGHSSQAVAPRPERPDRPTDTLSTREFNERYNVAFVEEHLPRASVLQVLKHYAASVAIYGCLLLLVTFNPWFNKLLSISFKGITGLRIYYGIFAAYVALAPIVLLIGRPRSLWVSKNLLVLGYLGRAARELFRREPGYDWRRCKPDYRETNALMFLLIKIVYGPLMLCSAMTELNNIPQFLFRLNFQTSWLDEIDVWFIVFVSGIFLVDSSLFFIGYTTESGLLRNRLRYAETNVFRILVCIACYAPFNMVTTSILGPSNHYYRIMFQDNLEHPMTWILRGLAVVFLLLLVSSSLFLFTKASNLTNRGIVKTGPYALVRHPGYIAKNLFWLTTLVPLFFVDFHAPDFSWSTYAIVCGKTTLGWLAWGSIYFLRAITEEQFLSKDPEYVEYCQKVKYRFIPWVY